MRLINADKLLENLEWLNEYDHIISEAVKASIDIAQLVEAIPIEWIEKWFSQFYGEQGLEWNRCKRFMLEDWEKENDR